MRVGLFQTVQWPEGTDQRRRYRETIDQCVAAEELGFDSVWLTEHHFTRHGITSDTFALLSHLAALTDRIRLGTAVSVLPFHEPVRLAESAAVVDHLSDGRLDVGIGRGYQWAEYHGFGIGFDEGSDRFEEALAILLQAWESTQPFAFDGKFHRYEAADPQPKPFQRPHPPLYHATGSDHGLRRCAEKGWGVLMAQATGPAVVADLVARHRGMAADADRAPGPLVLARGMHCATTDEAAHDTFMPAYAQFLEAAAKVAAPPGADPETPRNPFELADGTALADTVVCGDPRRCGDALERIAELGIDEVVLFVNMGGIPHDDVMASLRLFAAEVLPRVR